MKEINLITHLIREFSLQRYLEIGVGPSCLTFDTVTAMHKVGIDPVHKTHLRPNGGQVIGATSDDFFSSNTESFQLVFIDGLHLCEQAARDIVNSWNALEIGGFILVHDCKPRNDAVTDRRHGDPTIGWQGDVYRAIVWFKDKYPDLGCVTISEMRGMAVIYKKRGDVLDLPGEELKRYMDLGFNWLSNNWQRIGLIEADDFLVNLLSGNYDL